VRVEVVVIDVVVLMRCAMGSHGFFFGARARPAGVAAAHGRRCSMLLHIAYWLLQVCELLVNTRGRLRLYLDPPQAASRTRKELLDQLRLLSFFVYIG
jgi:hypothetical protein